MTCWVEKLGVCLLVRHTGDSSFERIIQNCEGNIWLRGVDCMNLLPCIRGRLPWLNSNILEWIFQGLGPIIATKWGNSKVQFPWKSNEVIHSVDSPRVSKPQISGEPRVNYFLVSMGFIFLKIYSKWRNNYALGSFKDTTEINTTGIQTSSDGTNGLLSLVLFFLCSYVKVS